MSLKNFDSSTYSKNLSWEEEVHASVYRYVLGLSSFSSSEEKWELQQGDWNKEIISPQE